MRLVVLYVARPDSTPISRAAAAAPHMLAATTSTPTIFHEPLRVIVLAPSVTPALPTLPELPSLPIPTPGGLLPRQLHPAVPRAALQGVVRLLRARLAEADGRQAFRRDTVP